MNDKTKYMGDAWLAYMCFLKPESIAGTVYKLLNKAKWQDALQERLRKKDNRG